MNREIVELRETVVKLTQLLAGKKLAVTQMGISAYVQANPKTGEPVRINIPNIPDNATPELIVAIQGFIDHEVAHVLFTDFLIKVDPKIHSIWNMLEDTYIERKMGELFPGARKNLKRTGEFFLNVVTAPKVAETTNDKDAFNWLMVPALRALAQQSVFVDFMDDNKHWTNPYIAELLAKLPPAVVARIPKLASTRECQEVAKIIEAIIRPPAPPMPKPAPAPKTPPSPPTPEPADADEGDLDDETEEDDEKGGSGPGEGKKEHGEDSEEASSPEPVDSEDSEASGDEEGESDESPADADLDEDTELVSDAGDVDGSDDGLGEDEEDPGETSETEDDAEGEGEDLGEKPDGRTEREETAPEDDEVEAEDGKPKDGSGGTGELEEGEGDAVPDELGDPEDGPDDREGEIGKGGETGLFENELVDASGLDLSSGIAAVIGDQSAVAIMDSAYSVFTRDFDVLEVCEPTSAYNDAWLPKLDETTRSMVGRMQKDVERMMASQSRVIKVGGQRKGRLNPPNLHRILSGDDKVFAQREVSRSKDTAVSILIDLSGSMSGEKYATAMVAAYALAATLDRVNIVNEAIGFTTIGFDEQRLPAAAADAMIACNRRGIVFSRSLPLYMPIFKEFNEKLTPAVKKRFAFGAYGQPGRAHNIDGECVEIGAVRLLKRREQRKVLLVLSDGNPAGGNDEAAVTRHLKATIADISKRGVDVVGIGIMDGSVKRFYEKNIVLNRLEELPTAVMGELKRILQ